MSSDSLPVRPDLDQLRRQAKELRDAAQSGDPAARRRIAAHGPVRARVTLSAAQLAVAREHGFASWARLKEEVEARQAALAQRVEEFLVASIRDWTNRPARMLARDPEIADYDFRTAVVLGDAARVRDLLDRDPTLAVRPDERTGWTALHAVCASQWNRIDTARAAGMTEVARLLLDAGAEPGATAPPPGRPGGRRWSPLFCAVAGAPNPAITRLLLERGARPDDDHMVYLAAFGDDHKCLELLLPYSSSAAATAALAAPISTNDADGVRILLAGGARPDQPLPGDLFGESHENKPPVPPLYYAVQVDCDARLVEMLLAGGADPDAAGWDGRTPYQLAVRRARDDMAGLLARYGARDETTSTDRFIGSCLRGDGAAARRLLDADPDLLARLGGDDHQALIQAADAGRTEAVRLMLDLGFPVGVRAADGDGATALHAAAASGSTAAVELLLRRGADIEARDTTWSSTPLEWAIVGSGMRLGGNPAPDWPGTVRALIEAGASTAGIVLSPDDDKPPSPEVAALLTDYGIPRQPGS